ncbi:MAG: hypothetical protein ABIL09_13995 [Gemmatimonadota bacterium]
MQVYLAAFAIFALVMLGMALGVVFGGRALRGSCGGLGSMRDAQGRPLCECGVDAGALCARDGQLTYQPVSGGDLVDPEEETLKEAAPA